MLQYLPAAEQPGRDCNPSSLGGVQVAETVVTAVCVNTLVVLNIIVMRYFMRGSVMSSVSENHPYQYNFHRLSYFWVLDNKDDV